MKLKIEVTVDDIKDGCRGMASNCPVARACFRAYHESNSDIKVVSAYTYEVVFYEAKSFTFGWGTRPKYKAKLPEHVSRFIDDFDRGEDVAPIEFEIELYELIQLNV